jgi:hypothetical protein
MSQRQHRPNPENEVTFFVLFFESPPFFSDIHLPQNLSVIPNFSWCLRGVIIFDSSRSDHQEMVLALLVLSPPLQTQS